MTQSQLSQSGRTQCIPLCSLIVKPQSPALRCAAAGCCRPLRSSSPFRAPPLAPPHLEQHRLREHARLVHVDEQQRPPQRPAVQPPYEAQQGTWLVQVLLQGGGGRPVGDRLTVGRVVPPPGIALALAATIAACC